MKKLSRIEMKKINGGSLQLAPPPPGSTGQFASMDEEVIGDGGTGCYKCCWDGGGACSSCSFSYSGAPCVSGASLSACTGC